MSQEDVFKKLIAHSKEYGYIFQSSEIYDGLGAVYDYGQYGTELKNNIRKYWWDAMVRLNENIVGIDAAIFMHPDVWKASGHVDAFKDPLIDNKDSKKRYRADVLVEDLIQKFEQKIQKETDKASKRFGEDFDKEKFLSTHPRVLEIRSKIEDVRARYVKAVDEQNMDGLKQIIMDYDVTDPVSGSRNWTDVRQFNLMFETQLGSLSEEASTIYLRPETAQGIFVNYLNVQKSGRMKIPFGIAQTGKAFRNEIVARQFIFRMREFEQMEMQFFVPPGKELEWFEVWKEKRMRWHKAFGLGDEKFRFYEHDNLAHYANAAYDIQYEFPFGFKEVEGIHSRTDYDLRQHEKYSGKRIRYFDTELNESYIPFVVETSIGLDRTFLMILSDAYYEETITKDDGSEDERVVMRIPPPLAPVKLAVFPLVKKDGLPEKAREVLEQLKYDFNCQYEEKDTIGRRYRRQDAIGTPYCITIDHETLKDDTVTIRDRDTMEQERVNINALSNILEDKVSLKRLLEKI